MIIEDSLLAFWIVGMFGLGAIAGWISRSTWYPK